MFKTRPSSSLDTLCRRSDLRSSCRRCWLNNDSKDSGALPTSNEGIARRDNNDEYSLGNETCIPRSTKPDAFRILLPILSIFTCGILVRDETEGLQDNGWNITKKVTVRGIKTKESGSVQSTLKMLPSFGTRKRENLSELRKMHTTTKQWEISCGCGTVQHTCISENGKTTLSQVSNNRIDFVVPFSFWFMIARCVPFSLMPRPRNDQYPRQTPLRNLLLFGIRYKFHFHSLSILCHWT